MAAQGRSHWVLRAETDAAQAVPGQATADSETSSWGTEEAAATEGCADIDAVCPYSQEFHAVET